MDGAENWSNLPMLKLFVSYLYSGASFGSNINAKLCRTTKAKLPFENLTKQCSEGNVKGKLKSVT